MLSLKRLLGIILIVAAAGGIFAIYNIYESRLAGVQFQSCMAPVREFTGTRQVDGGEKPRVLMLGNPEDERCGKIYQNVRQFCGDIHLAVAEEERLNVSMIGERDVVIFCDASVSRYADRAELERFIAGGGRVILAAGLAEEEADSGLWQAFGIREKSSGDDYHDLIFEEPLLPIQPEQVYFDGDSASAQIEVSDEASVYIRDEENEVPILYTYAWKKGSVCLINGMFLDDIRYIGLLTGAIGALLPDFIYPVLGVKAVFLDNFPIVTSSGDMLCRQAYGYSEAGFLRDVVWPSFQGISLRTNTPYTASVLAVSSENKFGEMGDAAFKTVGKLVLQFGGELVYAADCSENGEIIFNENFIQRFSAALPSYTVQGLVMETDHFSPKILEAPGADIRSVRGMLKSGDTRLSWEDGCTVFPAATEGSSMEDGNLFAICSVLGAYGMVSHIFDVNMLIVGDGNRDTAAWDLDSKQIGIFEAEILDCTPWLEGRTLTQTEGDVKSYQDMDYGWTKDGSRVALNCSGIAKGQAFFYHTGSSIAYAEGLTYEDVGNGYYLLRVQENHAVITLEEGK